MLSGTQEACRAVVSFVADALRVVLLAVCGFVVSSVVAVLEAIVSGFAAGERAFAAFAVAALGALVDGLLGGARAAAALVLGAKLLLNGAADGVAFGIETLQRRRGGPGAQGLLSPRARRLVDFPSRR